MTQLLFEVLSHQEFQNESHRGKRHEHPKSILITTKAKIKKGRHQPIEHAIAEYGVFAALLLLLITEATMCQ
jgi:hypothetical protein